MNSIAWVEKLLLVMIIPFLQSLMNILAKKLWTSGRPVNSHLSSSAGVFPSRSFWMQLINISSLFNDALKLVRLLYSLGSVTLSLNPNISKYRLITLINVL